MDTRYHFLKELVEKQVFKVRFIKTKENDANMLTKNVGHEEYKRMMDRYLIDVNDIQNSNHGGC